MTLKYVKGYLKYLKRLDEQEAFSDRADELVGMKQTEIPDGTILISEQGGTSARVIGKCIHIDPIGDYVVFQPNRDIARKFPDMKGEKQ